MKTEVLGIKVSSKKPETYDKNWPFHGEMAVKKETFVGTVIKKDTHGSATIEWSRTMSVPKYERSEIRTSKMRVHNPVCINAEIGQKVLVAKTRPISKSKHHTILKVFKEKE